MLSVQGLIKTFPVKSGSPVVAVNQVSLEIKEGELFTLLGPSGCGKTTTLRAIAGLEKPDSGHIQLQDRILFSSTRSIDLPAHARHIGMVFQSYAIWPHLSVFENVAFPLRTGPRRSRPARAAIRLRVMEALEKVELGPFAERPATNLSGGQQQRLALARSLVRNSGVLLLDEPLSNLDAKLRESMRFELKRMQREFGLTTLYVTHDQTEALGLSSRLAVMRDGQVVQIGKPREIYEQPINRFVADFVGTSNFIECVVEAVEDRGVYRVTTSAGSLRARGPRGFEAGTLAAVSIRPEQIEMRAGETPSGEGGGNEMPGSVVERQYLGDFMDYVVRTGDINLRVRCNPSFRLRAGTNVVLSMHPDQCILIMPD